MSMLRIVVMQQAWPAGDKLLRAAAGAATRMNSELTGLFIEDSDLLKLAGMPFACEVCFPSATRRELNTQQLERTLRSLAEEARRSLEALARHSALRSSFRVARGSLLAELLASVSETDVVVAGTLSRVSSAPGLSVFCVAGTAPAVIAELIDDLAPWAYGSIALVVLGADADTLPAWEVEVRKRLARKGLARRVRVLAPGDERELYALLRRPVEGAG